MPAQIEDSSRDGFPAGPIGAGSLLMAATVIFGSVYSRYVLELEDDFAVPFNYLDWILGSAVLLGPTCLSLYLWHLAVNPNARWRIRFAVVWGLLLAIATASVWGLFLGLPIVMLVGGLGAAMARGPTLLSTAGAILLAFAAFFSGPALAELVADALPLSRKTLVEVLTYTAIQMLPMAGLVVTGSRRAGSASAAP